MHEARTEEEKSPFGPPCRQPLSLSALRGGQHSGGRAGTMEALETRVRSVLHVGLRTTQSWLLPRASTYCCFGHGQVTFCLAPPFPYWHLRDEHQLGRAEDFNQIVYGKHLAHCWYRHSTHIFKLDFIFDKVQN